ncbi:phospholipase, patatin family, partial [Ancylostoma ceylanicum]
AGSLDLVKLLILFDADINAVDAQGQSVHEINKSSKRRADIDTLLTIANSPPAPASAAQTKTPWDYQQESAIQVQKENKEDGGERVNLLSLDGGGIRGLVVIQMLSELEKKFGTDLLSSFGWLGGTSTGAILALALCQGKSIAHCRSMYFRLKDELFCGERPYDGALLDSFLRSEFGEDTTLADITSKNAAPTYFPPFDKKYVDGGLLANNPCPQLLTDVQLVNTSLRMA